MKRTTAAKRIPEPETRNPNVESARQQARRAYVERRVRFLEREERRFARGGFAEEAHEAARERRYWEFMRALLSGSPITLEAPTTLH